MSFRSLERSLIFQSWALVSLFFYLFYGPTWVLAHARKWLKEGYRNA